MSKLDLYRQLMRLSCMFDLDRDIIRNLRIASDRSIEPGSILVTETTAACHKAFTASPKISWFAADPPEPPPPRAQPDVFHWQDCTVARLVVAVIQGTVPHAILADALDDAGCADSEIISHLRLLHHHPDCWAIGVLVDDLPEECLTAMLSLEATT